VQRKNRDPVGAYLRAQFPAALVERHELPDDAHEYRVLSKTGVLRHRVEVSKEFVENRSADEVTRVLTEWELAGKLRAAWQQRLRVTSRGVSEA
jgi:hypothetical protein